jgi:hypothetical protein
LVLTPPHHQRWPPWSARRTCPSLTSQVTNYGWRINEVLDELVPDVPGPKRRSVKGLLEGKLDNLAGDADFEGLHQDMLKRYGPDVE